MKTRRKEQLNWNPLELIAEENFDDLKNPGRSLDLEALTIWLAERAKQQYIRIDPLKIDSVVVTRVMSYEFAQRHQILALEVKDDEVVVVSAQPYIHSWETTIEQSLPGKILTRVVANPSDIRRCTTEFYTMARSVNKANASGLQTSSLSNLEQMLELGQIDQMEANDAHIVNIVDWLLNYAFTQRASDIHLEPRRDKGRVRFRIDGVLHLVYELPAPVMTAVISRLKTLGRMDVAEKRRPQDGRLKTKMPDQHEVELRLATLPTAHGEKMVMRIFDPDILLKTFEQLGLANDDYARWENMVSNPNGIVLVTGPTGSGKTTTLYTSLKHLATSEVNVCTIEDPIEMVEPSFNQMQVQHNIDLTFADGVRALLRQDPDIIMVGEIRDLETAEMAIQAALTGHLVISTLHTNDAPSAITRLLEIGVAPYLIKATVLGIMAQRLVRTLCPACKSPGESDVEGWKTLTTPWKMKMPVRMQQPIGCLDCRDTGYRGRQGIYELLPMTDTIKGIVEEDVDIGKIRLAAMKEGMKTLRLSGAMKVAAGETTIAEVLRVAPFSGTE
ncbi:MAG: type II/IV secretion system protein [Pseudomonadales bacterium]|nr:type II/IV secretion system protein [Pseudomonadales bacterium]MBO6563727.1 type II/IV secretion system protein [Pseudomonadales bacterium]MBO6597355.1 type II/IV secretion system protein [Pseudomonadales bacterium]MBO6703151.1 type II/IV secretion system protein [Pseudomonadales bacterium]MBO6824089.1 type II/IV secretion system protein [Pseudomonadales bacterium]